MSPPSGMGRPSGMLALDEVAELLGVTGGRLRRLIRGPLVARWGPAGELLVAEEDLVAFVAARRSW